MPYDRDRKPVSFIEMMKNRKITEFEEDPENAPDIDSDD